VVAWLPLSHRGIPLGPEVLAPDLREATRLLTRRYGSKLAKVQSRASWDIGQEEVERSMRDQLRAWDG
jgi:hypothetical protein